MHQQKSYFGVSSFRLILTLAILLFVLSPNVLAQSRKSKNVKGKPFAVVEFFTSENCIRCLEAAKNAVTIEKAARDLKKDIFLLSFHIDYLNNAVWKDSLSSRVFSERQLSYAEYQGLGRAVAGEMIVNGQYSAPGEDFVQVNRKIRRALNVRPRAVISLKKRFEGKNAVDIDFQVKGVDRIRREFFYFHAALVEGPGERKVPAGPNADKTFEHVNTVRAFESVRFEGKPGKGELRLVFPQVFLRKGAAVICYVQDPRKRQILGAKKFELVEKQSESAGVEK